MAFTQLPQTLIPVTIFQVSKSGSCHWCGTVYSPWTGFPLYSVVRYCPAPGSHPESHLQLVVMLPQSPSICPQSVRQDLDTFKEYWPFIGFVESLSTWGYFSHDYIRVLYFWQGSHRRDVMPFQGPARWHVTSEYLTTGGVNSDHWWRWCLPGPCKVPALPSLINECFGEVFWNSVNVLFLILSSV